MGQLHAHEQGTEAVTASHCEGEEVSLCLQHGGASGYSGAMGPFALELDTDKAIVQPPRWHSPAEQLIINAKTQEVFDAGVVNEYKAPTRCAVNPVVAAKKDADTGLWTEDCMAQDYRAAPPTTSTACTDPTSSKRWARPS